MRVDGWKVDVWDVGGWDGFPIRRASALRYVIKPLWGC